MLPQWAQSLLEDYDPQAEGRARAARAEGSGLSSAEQRWLLDSLGAKGGPGGIHSGAPHRGDCR